MSKPTTPYIKLAALQAWLCGEGFTASTVRELRESGSIPKHVFKGRVRAYYHVPSVAAALSIADPLSQPTKHTITPC